MAVPTDSSGSLSYWGLGVTYQDVYGAEPGGIDFVMLSGGASIACGVSENARAHCWSWNDDMAAELGKGIPQYRVMALAAGYSHACLLAEDGSPECFGLPSGGAETVPNGL